VVAADAALVVIVPPGAAAAGLLPADFASSALPSSTVSPNQPPTVLIMPPIASPIALNGAIMASITGDSHSTNLNTTPFMPAHIEVNKSFTHSHAEAKSPVTEAHTPENQLATDATACAMPSHAAVAAVLIRTQSPTKNADTASQFFMRSTTPAASRATPAIIE
jgi:hypothetical protein